MRFLIASLALLTLLSAPPAHATRFSGIYLFQLCDMDENGKEKVAGGHTACQAYIAGVIDYHAVLQSMKIAPRINICVPRDIASSQLHVTVLKYLQKNHQHDDFTAAPAVTMALYEVFPCRGK